MSKFEIYKGDDTGEECWRWRLLDDKENNIGSGGEAFLKGSILPSIKKIQGEVGAALVVKNESSDDIDKGYRFEYEKNDKDNQWYWRFKAPNHKIMAIGGEGFSSESEVRQQIENFKKNAINAEIIWENEKDNPAWQEINDDRTEPIGPLGS